MSVAPGVDMRRKPFLVLIAVTAALDCGGDQQGSGGGGNHVVVAEGGSADGAQVPILDGGAPEEAGDDSSTISDSPESSTTSSGPTFLLGAQRQSDLLLVRLDAVTATLEPFGGPIGQAPQAITRLSASADLSRAIVLLGPAGCCTGALGSYQGLAADDVGFHLLGPQTGGCGWFAVSPDATLVWLGLAQMDASTCSTHGAAMLKFDGSSIYQTPPPPSDQGPVLGGFSPDGQWFLYWHDGVLTRRTLAGQENVIRVFPQDANTGGSPGAGMPHLWPTSILLDGGYPNMELFDTSGAPLSIPGFTPDATLVGLNAADGNAYYVSAGTLYRIDDRALTPIQTVPSSFDVRHVAATTPGKMLLAQKDATTWVATGADAKVLATFAPPSSMVPPSPSMAPVSTVVSLSDVVLTDTLSSALFFVQYDAGVAEDLTVTLAFYRELWTFDKNGFSSVSVVEEFHNEAGTIPPSRTLDSFAISPSGDYVAHVGASSHALSVIDTKSGVPRPVSSDLVFSGDLVARR
jgi:hypothetical protein